MSPKTTFQASAGTFTGILPYFGKHYWLTLSDRPSIPHRCQRAKYIMPALHLLLKNIHNLKTLVPPSQAFLCHGSFKGSAQTPRFSDCREWTSGTHKRFSVSFFFSLKEKFSQKKKQNERPILTVLTQRLQCETYLYCSLRHRQFLSLCNACKIGNVANGHSTQ